MCVCVCVCVCVLTTATTHTHTHTYMLTKYTALNYSTAQDDSPNFALVDSCRVLEPVLYWNAWLLINSRVQNLYIVFPMKNTDFFINKIYACEDICRSYMHCKHLISQHRIFQTANHFQSNQWSYKQPDSTLAKSWRMIIEIVNLYSHSSKASFWLRW